MNVLPAQRLTRWWRVQLISRRRNSASALVNSRAKNHPDRINNGRSDFVILRHPPLTVVFEHIHTYLHAHKCRLINMHKSSSALVYTMHPHGDLDPSVVRAEAIYRVRASE